MTDLAAFLTARLDEDEALARQAAQVAGPDWTFITEVPEGCDYPTDYITSTGGTLLLDTMGGIEEDAPHVARHDPARVLREVEAKRQLVRRAIEARTMAEGDRQAQADHGPDWGPCRPFSEQRERTYWEYVLPYLGLIYADHLDYDPAWRP